MIEYRIRVRGTTYLWGSAGVTVNLGWPMFLTIRNDDYGEVISFSTEAMPRTARRALARFSRARPTPSPCSTCEAYSRTATWIPRWLVRWSLPMSHRPWPRSPDVGPWAKAITHSMRQRLWPALKPSR